MNGSRVCSDEQFQGTTDKPFKGYFRDWQIRNNYEGRLFIVGEFVDHPEFHGKRGHSSLIENMIEYDDYVEVETRNSIYRLRYDDKEPDREFWNMS